MKPCHLLIILVLALLFSFSARAQIPQHLSYQGVFSDTLGNPKPEGTYTFTFRLYETSTGGTPIWTEIKDLQVKGGLFSTLLGNVTPFGSGVRFDKPYWLGVKPGSDPELSPRIPMSSVGYSFNALKADTVSDRSVTTAKLADGAIDASKIAANAVDGSKVADGSLRLADLAVWTLAGNIGGATVPASGCAYFNFGAPSGGLASDLVLPRSGVAVLSGTALSAYFSGSNIIGGVCNFTTSAVTLPNPFVLTIYGIR